MKKIAALGLAAAMAVGALSVSGAASAKPWPPHPPYPMHHNWHPHSNFYVGTPFFLGFSFGPQYRYVRPYPNYSVSYSNLHVEWCLNRYRTYNPATNTFFIRKGVPAVCVSPYWGGY